MLGTVLALFGVSACFVLSFNEVVLDAGAFDFTRLLETRMRGKEFFGILKETQVLRPLPARYFGCECACVRFAPSFREPLSSSAASAS